MVLEVWSSDSAEREGRRNLADRSKVERCCCYCAARGALRKRGQPSVLVDFCGMSVRFQWGGGSSTMEGTARYAEVVLYANGQR